MSVEKFSYVSPYKTITSQNVSSEAQVKFFFIYRKVMFHSQDIQIFLYLKQSHDLPNPESATSR